MFLLFSVDNAAVAQDQKVFVTQFRNLDNSIEFRYTKEAIGSYFVEVELENAENVDNNSFFDKNLNFNLNSNSGTLFKLTPLDKDKKIQCSYSFNYKVGVIGPKVDDLITYRLPFRKNKKVAIYELNRFGVSPNLWKTYIYYSKTKDTIYGMRKGVVVDIKKIAATSLKIADEPATVYRTEVIVEHADGTNASYTGLNEKMLLVKLGQTIYPQTTMGVMDDFTDSNLDHNFRFNIYYFSNEQIDNLSGKKSKVMEKSVMPNFLTENGSQRLDGEKSYIVKSDDSVLFQEMTPDEKAKYFMNSQAF